MIDQGIIKQVAEEFDLPPKVIERVYFSFWKHIAYRINSLPFDRDDLTEEDFKELHPYFNIPALGKLVCRYGRYKSLKEIEARFNAEAKESEASV